MPRAKESLQAPATAQAQQDAVSDGIENYELPKSLVTRIAKSAIPENSKLQKDMVTALVQGSTVFINYLAATAHDIATSRQHKSVSASDVLKALESLQFVDMVDKIQEELKVYRELQKSGKKSGRGGESASTAKSKGKGKEKMVVDDQQSHEETENTTQHGAGDADGDGDQEMLDVDHERVPDEEGDDESGPMEDELEEDELLDDDEELAPEQNEPLEDAMAVEEEELRRDQARADLKEGNETDG
ncbi:histone-fold-containing protein [Schizopora paradoxa]|uniref:DNA polymerase epsilon subunit D n=1 Tax=Schizopora paradoxa TaxID=27342 RepID=A0A0H2S016_9AGAM|nr:histone-fold-containing protein [Schizopora paradoxa]